MATKTFKVSLSLDNPRIIQTGIKVRSFDKQSIKIAIELTKNSQVYQIPTGAQIKISLLKLARQEQKIIVDVPNTNRDSIDWVVPDYLDGYQGEVRVGVYLIVGTENIDVGYFNITSSVSDIDSAAEEFTESVLQGWAIEDLTALLPKFQEVIDETTGKDVISAPEIILARGEATTLGERLDSEKAEFSAQLAQKANRSQVDTFEARMEDIIQSSDLDPNKDQEVVDARLGKPTLGSKIQEIDEFSDYYAGSGVGVSSGRTLAWERGSLSAIDGSNHPSSYAIRTIDYFYGKKGNIIFLPDARYFFTVLEYVGEDNYVGVSVSDVNSYTIGNQLNLLKIIIKKKDGTVIHLSEIRDISGKLFFSKNEGMFDHIKKEISFNRLNLISHEGEDYNWEHGIYRANDGATANIVGRIRVVDYLEVDKNDIISIASSFDYYMIRYDHKFNMIDSSEYMREDYVIENEAVKYIRPVIKVYDSTTPSPQDIEEATSSFRVYKRTKDAFKGQSQGAGRGYEVRIGGIGQLDADITKGDDAEYTLTAIKSLVSRSDFKESISPNSVHLPVGYLYHASPVSASTKLYYSANQSDNPKHIGDLDFNPSRYQSAIGEDGEIIWVHDGPRTTKPKVHIGGEYNNSVSVQTDVTPIAWLQNNGIDFAKDASGNEYCIFGEYIGSRVGDVYLWKVTKPYNDPDNWKRVLAQTQTTNAGTSDGDVWHFHTVNHDPYSGVWYATSGDTDASCKWWCSTDEGENWTLIVQGDTVGWESQIARTVGVIFTEEYVYWANDYGTNHSLNRVEKDDNGVIDPSTRVKLAELNKNQSTYTTALLHSPPGLLMYDRVDTAFGPRTNELEVQFYSFDDEKVHTLATLERDPSKPNSFFGLRCKTYTLYQGIYDTKMIVGFGTSPNWLVMPYNDTERRTTLTFDIY